MSVAVAIAVSVGCNRIYIGAHWPVDVVRGCRHRDVCRSHHVARRDPMADPHSYHRHGLTGGRGYTGGQNGAAGRTSAPNLGDAGERRRCRPVSVRRHLTTPERHRHACGRSRPVSPNTFDAVDCAPAPAASAARTPPRGYSCRTSGVSRARGSAGRDRSSGSPAGAAARARPRTNRRRWNEGVRRSPVPPARVRPGRSDVRVPPSRRTASARPGNARHLRQRPS
jgi:hypothetical protein